jgi:dipeptidyl aminopeptidase/acylaminoacyl peptidase
MTDRRPLTPADIRRQVVLEQHDLSADGRVAVVVRRSVQGRRYLAHLLVIPLADRRAVSPPTVLTRGTVFDGWPRLAPDGLTVAFIRSLPDDEEAPATLALARLRGGRVRSIRSAGHGSVSEVAWSPDGGRLAYVAQVDPPRFLVGDVPPIGRRRRRAPDAATDAPLARRITRTDWRLDGTGHLDRWSHLFVVDMQAGARPRQLTSGDWGVADIAWRPDGRTIAFTTDRGAEPDLHPRTTIWAVDADTPGAEPREVLAPPGWANHPAWSPDGRWLAVIGILEAEPLDDLSPGLLLGPADGSRPPHALAPELDRPIGNWVDTDLHGWMVSSRSGPAWLDERTIVAVVSDRGRSLPLRFRLDPASGAPVDPPVVDPAGPWSDATSHSLAVSAAGTVSVLGTLGTRAMELMTLDGSGAAGHWITRSSVGSAWQRRHPSPVMRRLDAPGPGGPIETWVASPPDASDAPLPTIVDVHGGPLGAWAPAPHIEVALLVARGYRVVLPNIRGSATYGRAWIRPQLGDWGGVDADDVHAALDHVIALGLADPGRLGVLGLSYGGFMANWLVGTSDRFRAAVSENGVTNQVSDWANSDTGPEYSRASLLGDPLSPDGVEHLWRQSPLQHVANMRTPLLMLQAEDDVRCPPQDNEQLFIALRHLGRTVEYVLYPGESHVFSSSGRPDRRIDRQTRMLDWFDRYILG